MIKNEIIATQHRCPLCNVLCNCGASEKPTEHRTPHPSFRCFDSKARHEIFKCKLYECTHKCDSGYGENHWSCDPYQDNAYQRRLKELDQENI